jgi:DNA-binding NtrC family response regulator
MVSLGSGVGARTAEVGEEMMGQHTSAAVREADEQLEAGSPTVLVCDDEERLASLTAELLEGFGFRGLAVASGREAIQTLSTAKPAIQLLLLDVNLTGEASARDILASLSAAHSSVPVVLISGQPRIDAPRELTSHPNVTGYLEKPYAAEALVGAVRDALTAG